MVKKGSLFIINESGAYLDGQRGTLRALDNYTSVIQVLAPFDADTVVEVSYLIYGANNETITQYMANTVYTGADVLLSTNSLYQTCQDWVLWEIPVSSRALAKISKYKAGQVGVSFSFKERYASPTAETYIGTFGLYNDLPSSSTNGDYYVCDAFNYASAESGITFTKNDVAVYIDGWTKPTQYLLLQNTTTLSLAVSGSMSAVIPETLTSDEEFELLFATLQAAVNQLQLDSDDIANGLYSVKAVQYNTTSPLADPLPIGATRWDDTFKCLETRLSTEVVLQHGLEDLLRVRNNTGSSIANLKALYVTGAVGQNPTIALATTADTNIASKTIVISTEIISNNETGFACRSGEAGGDTSAWGDGDDLYLSTSGNLTNVIPSFPTPIIKIGTVLYSHSSLGRIMVSISAEDYTKMNRDLTNQNLSSEYSPTEDNHIANKKYVDDTDTSLQSQISELDTNKVDKTTTIIGIDLQNNISLTEFKTALGEATTLLSGLMSSSDKTKLEALYALLNDTTDGSADSFVDTIEDMLAIFQNYPEGVDLVTALLAKVDKTTTIAGIDLQDNVTAEELKTALDIDDLETLSSQNASDIEDIVDGTTVVAKANADANGNVIDETYETIENVNLVKVQVAEHETRIDNIESTLIKQEETTVQSSVVGTDIVSLPQKVAGGSLKVKLDGLALQATQKIANSGPIFIVTTGWTGGLCSLRVTSGEIELYTATPQTAPNTYNNTLAFDNGTKVYMAVVAKGNADTTQIDLKYRDIAGGITSSATSLTTSLTTYQFLSNLVTLSAISGAGGPQIIFNGTSSTNSNYVKYAYTFNVSNLISNKQYSPLSKSTFDLISDTQIKAQMDAWVLDGTLPNDNLLSASPMKMLEATEKNLFDYQKYATSYAYKIGVKPSTQYTWSESVAYKTYDINLVEVASGTGTSVTTGAGTFYIAFSGIATPSTFQLELGSTATTYEAFKSTTQFIQGNNRLYSLPNGTKDSQEIRNGKYYEIHKIKTADVVGVVAVNTTNYPLAKNGGQFINYLTTGGTETGVIGTNSTSGSGFLLYELATQTETLLETSGTLLGSASGSVNVLNGLSDIDIYGTNATVTNTSYPIISLKKLQKIVGGLAVDLTISSAVIAGDGLSFTHPSLASGDIVYFEYLYDDSNGVSGLATIYYYDGEFSINVPLTKALQGINSKPDYDYVNIGLQFPQNDTSEYVEFIVPLPPDRIKDSEIYLHVHGEATKAGSPTFRAEYKWFNQYDLVPASFTTYDMAVMSGTWSTGTLAVEISGTMISGVGKGADSILKVKLYRTDNSYVGDFLVDVVKVHGYKK